LLICHIVSLSFPWRHCAKLIGFVVEYFAGSQAFVQPPNPILDLLKAGIGLQDPAYLGVPVYSVLFGDLRAGVPLHHIVESRQWGGGVACLGEASQYKSGP